MVKYAKGQCVLNKSKGFIETNINRMHFAMRMYRVTKNWKYVRRLDIVEID